MKIPQYLRKYPVLVRERVICLREADGFLLRWHEVTEPIEKAQVLGGKLIEEIAELDAATDRVEEDLERVDVWTVYCAIERHKVYEHINAEQMERARNMINRWNIHFPYLIKMRAKKRKAKGEFDRLYVIDSETHPDLTV